MNGGKNETEGFGITADGLTQHMEKESEEGLRIESVRPGQTIVMTTKSGTRYRFVVENPTKGIGTLQGGSYFQEPTKVRLMGSKATHRSGMIVNGVIQKGLVIEIQGLPGEKEISDSNIINTSIIKEIYVEE